MSLLNEEVLDINRLVRYIPPQIVDRGRAYYNQRRVEVDYVEPDYASCTVVGKEDVYSVTVQVDRTHLYVICNCPYGAEGRICKHGVASILAVRDYVRTHKPLRWQAQLTKVIQSLQDTKNAHSAPYLLFFSLQKKASIPEMISWSVSPYQLHLNRLSSDQRSALQSGQLPDQLASLAGLLISPYNTLPLTGCVNESSQAVTVANLLINQIHNYNNMLSLGNLLALLSGVEVQLFQGTQQNPLEKRLKILPEPGRIHLDLARVQEGVRLSAGLAAGEEHFPLNGAQVHVLSSNPYWILADRCLVQVEGEGLASLLANFVGSPELLIPSGEETDFLENYYLALANAVELRGDAVSREMVDEEPAKRLYLTEEKGVLQAQLRFRYGSYEVQYEARRPAESLRRMPGTWTLAQVRRRPVFEQKAFESLAAPEYGLKRAPSPALPGDYILRARIHPVDFLMKHIPHLARDGFEIFGEEALKTARVNRTRPTLSLNVSSGIDWFDVRLTVNFGDVTVAFKEIRKALQRRERYIKLADGTLGEIPEEWLEKYKHLFALGRDMGDSLRLSSHHMTLLDQLLAETDRSKADEEFHRRSSRLRDFAGIQPQELPSGFNGELRPYQKAGFDWLHFLHDFNYGGCLADDMGLGKTVQVLVFLRSLRERGHSQNSDLVVLPRSLLVNWQRETARFTPEARVLEYHGNLRDKDTAVFNDYDLVVTTYGVMMRDIELLKGYKFHYVVLDESQVIKNPVAQTSKAARLLQSDHRLVMTGTPVENSTFELWSQFAFLNPGLLGNLEYFKREFGTPIEKQSDEQKAQFLRKMVYPFILRRTKDQVAPELPPRTERILYTDMEFSQQKLYNRTRDYYRGMLLGLLDSQGMENVRMKVLEGLLRLRQICNHPALIDGGLHGESAKFELLLETLETLRVEGHKALIFSQFVEMLKLVRAELDRRHIPYTYLDGHTQNRQERVDTFQSDASIPFFLISLKAGGLGLNLTAADYVIHIDPWWNPAVEMQATDRTHRIGQDKPVFVYKMIVRESVEEKILQLQDRKRNLVDQLITTESNFLKSLTSEDVQVLFS